MSQKRRHFAILVTMAAVCAAAVLYAQSPFTPPPDVAAPPADAVKSETGLASKVLMPGTGTEKP